MSSAVTTVIVVVGAAVHCGRVGGSRDGSNSVGFP